MLGCPAIRLSTVASLTASSLCFWFIIKVSICLTTQSSFFSAFSTKKALPKDPFPKILIRLYFSILIRLYFSNYFDQILSTSSTTLILLRFLLWILSKSEFCVLLRAPSTVHFFASLVQYTARVTCRLLNVRWGMIPVFHTQSKECRSSEETINRYVDQKTREIDASLGVGPSPFSLLIMIHIISKFSHTVTTTSQKLAPHTIFFFPHTQVGCPIKAQYEGRLRVIVTLTELILILFSHGERCCRR